MDSSNMDKRAQRKPNQINYKDMNRIGIKDVSQIDPIRNLHNINNLQNSSKVNDSEFNNGLPTVKTN